MLGFYAETEMYNETTDAWEDYLDLPDIQWTTLGCLTAYEGMIYHASIRPGEEGGVVQLDPSTWTETYLGPLPDDVRQPFK